MNNVDYIDYNCFLVKTYYIKNSYLESTPIIVSETPIVKEQALHST